MSTFVAKLAAIYREELALYNEVLGLVRGERDALVKGRPLGEVIDSFEKKRQILRAVESMEQTISAEKGQYKRSKSLIDPGVTHELNETIKAIKLVIQEIMKLEDENERTILSHGEPITSPDGSAVVTGGGVDAG